MRNLVRWIRNQRVPHALRLCDPLCLYCFDRDAQRFITAATEYLEELDNA